MRTERRRMMAHAKYELLEYVENPNGGYIDIGIYGNENLDFSIKVDFRNVQAFAFGCRRRLGTAVPDNSYAFLCQEANMPRFDSGTFFNRFMNDTTKPIEAIKVGSNIVVAGSKYSLSIANVTTPATLIAFGINNYYDDVKVVYDIKIYYLTFTRDDELLRDFIPVRRRSDGKVGLLDRVENKFYTSPNGAEFVGG